MGAPRVRRRLWGRCHQGYLQGRHVFGQLDRDGRLHVHDIVVPEKIPQLFLVLVDHLDHPGQEAGASAPILAIPQTLAHSGPAAQFLIWTSKVHPLPPTTSLARLKPTQLG